MSQSVILRGHVMEQLRNLPEQSVHCVVTSPPYWGLRNYNTEPQIWANSSPLCEDHDWEAAAPRRRRTPQDAISDLQSKGSLCSLPSTTFCRTCHAWRGELGLEPTPELYIDHLVQIFREISRVLRNDGTLWLNVGDSYATGNGCLKPKDMVGIPWMLAFALRADGWYLRQDIIWHKPNPMPESVRDRCSKAHEYLFLLTKQRRYYYDAEAIYEPAAYDGRKDTQYKGGDKDVSIGAHERWPKQIKTDESKSNSRNGKGIVGHSGYFKANGEPNFVIKDGVPAKNRRSVWSINTEAFRDAHFATFPQELIEICVKAGTSSRGVCGECGTQWKRIVEKHTAFQSGSGKTRIPSGWHQSGSERHAPRDCRLDSGKHKDQSQSQSGDFDIRMGPVNIVDTIGWNPSCNCAADAIPAVVLDPFGGSGTTGLVAHNLGRRFILIELNDTYADIAERRIRSACGFLSPI